MFKTMKFKRFTSRLSLLSVLISVVAPTGVAAQGREESKDLSVLRPYPIACVPAAQPMVKGLRETPASDLWEVLRSQDGKVWEEDGVFQVEKILDLPGEKGALEMEFQIFERFHRSLMVGELTDADGTRRFISAHVIDFGRDVVDQFGAPLRTFSIVQEGGTIEGVLAFADKLADLKWGNGLAEKSILGCAGGLFLCASAAAAVTILCIAGAFPNPILIASC